MEPVFSSHFPSSYRFAPSVAALFAYVHSDCFDGPFILLLARTRTLCVYTKKWTHRRQERSFLTAMVKMCLILSQDAPAEGAQSTLDGKTRVNNCIILLLH